MNPITTIKTPPILYPIQRRDCLIFQLIFSIITLENQTTIRIRRFADTHIYFKPFIQCVKLEFVINNSSEWTFFFNLN